MLRGGGSTGPDPVSSHSLPNARSPNNLVHKQSTDSHAHIVCTQSEDIDAFALGLQLTSAGFDAVQPSTVHTSGPDLTHPLTVKSLQHLGGDFGCIPLGDFKLYAGLPIIWQSVRDIIQAHKLIRASGVPNFWGQRNLVKSDINIPSWRVDLIQYRFPLDFDRNLDLISTFKNHASAVDFATHVDQYIKEELHHGALLGPLDHPP